MSSTMKFGLVYDSGKIRLTCAGPSFGAVLVLTSQELGELEDAIQSFLHPIPINELGTVPINTGRGFKKADK